CIILSVLGVQSIDRSPNGCKSIMRCLCGRKGILFNKKDIIFRESGPVIQVHSFFVFNTFFSSMGEKLYAFLDIFKVIF
ncbi:hypothetical protein P4H28_02100, partial [Paenibacillus larvae]